jgi:hypothetical protein
LAGGVISEHPPGQIGGLTGWVEQFNPFSIRFCACRIVHHLADHHVRRGLGAAKRWDECGKQGEQENYG